ncbi:hypothetical protein [Aureimonas sp. ME7]|uniref:hypothetical protein n=1 Tax=Aureimonas sp. ME7 TaxID=2744252 RepID=UPI0015FA52B1|nr:hypothetical protein [Aureimonas sp. ME7]
MTVKPTRDQIVDAYLLGEFYDCEPDAYPEGSAAFLANMRREYPEHVFSGERVADRVMLAFLSPEAPASSKEEGE